MNKKKKKKAFVQSPSFHEKTSYEKSKNYSSYSVLHPQCHVKWSVQLTEDQKQPLHFQITKKPCQ